MLQAKEAKDTTKIKKKKPKRASYYIKDNTLIIKLKKLAAEQETFLSNLLEEAIRDVLLKYKHKHKQSR